MCVSLYCDRFCTAGNVEGVEFGNKVFFSLFFKKLKKKRRKHECEIMTNWPCSYRIHIFLLRIMIYMLVPVTHTFYVTLMMV